MEEIRKVISVIVKNEHGVLSRISGLFAARGYNIGTLTVAPIPNSDFSRLTIATKGSEAVIEQIVKQLNKLVPVLKVLDSSEIEEKEMVLVKFSSNENLSDIEVVSKTYNGHIVNVGLDYVVSMVADTPDRIKNYLKVIKRFTPIEVVRGGVVSIER
jgi:acetolactate synthase-1/3 small subunit